MRIGCPACAATYEVPEERLTPGRVVRCARCGSDWVPREADFEADGDSGRRGRRADEETFVERVQAVTAVPEAIPLPGPARVLEPERRRGRGGAAALLAAWVVSVALVAGAVWYGYSARAAIMAAWPPSVRAYHWFGLDR